MEQSLKTDSRDEYRSEVARNTKVRMRHLGLMGLDESMQKFGECPTCLCALFAHDGVTAAEDQEKRGLVTMFDLHYMKPTYE